MADYKNRSIKVTFLLKEEVPPPLPPPPTHGSLCSLPGVQDGAVLPSAEWRKTPEGPGSRHPQGPGQLQLLVLALTLRLTDPGQSLGGTVFQGWAGPQHGLPAVGTRARLRGRCDSWDSAFPPGPGWVAGMRQAGCTALQMHFPKNPHNPGGRSTCLRSHQGHC